MKQEKSKPLAIVVVAYNREEPLKQLLSSLNAIVTDRRDIALEISIDNKGTPEVIRAAETFIWKHGKKELIVHPEKLGLKKHFIWAGDRTEKYENILFVEDDLYVSPYVMDFVDCYLNQYENDERIAGAALYSPILCEFTKCKFYQYQDGFDNYFFQHPYWGNLWSKQKWRLFKNWWKNYTYNGELLPSNVRMWGSQSFKKIYIQYLIETDRYMVYPRNSYVTNMGVKGLHNHFNAIQFQVVLENGKRELRMSTLDESKSIYDAFFEIKQDILKMYHPVLENYEFSVDLNGMKDHIKEEYVLTCKDTKRRILSFSSSMRPAEQNVIANIPGEGIYFTKVSDLITLGKAASRIQREKKCTEDIMKNYPVRAKHFAFSTWIALLRK